MAFLDPVDTITRKEIVPGVVDLVFKSSPLLAYLKQNCLKPYNGGPSWQENFMYDVLNGGDFQSGDTFDITQVQIENGLTVTPRRYQVSVSAYLDKLKMELNGPEAVFDYVDLRMQNAALTMSAKLAIDAYKDGQSSGRTTKLNGLSEGLSDGATASYDGNTYTTYLGITRSTVGDALDSPMTNPAASVSGAIDYPTLEQAWNSVVVGTEEPDLIVTTNTGMSFIKMAFQSQQRFEGMDAMFGFRGVKFNGSMIMQDQYCPGLYGVNDAKLGNYYVSTGETLWILNTKYLRFYVSTDDLMGFGFTGFKPSQNSLTVAGQYLFAGNLTVPAPRYSRVLHAITA